MAYDLVIKDGLIVDGTGKPAYPGDVAVQQGKIAAVGKVDGTGRRTIQAGGLVVSPGFVDPHTHYDAQLLWDPSATPSCNHGVTTVLIGNCGYTLAPVRAKDQDYLMGLFSAAEEVPKAALQTYAPFPWESFPEYLGWLERRGTGVNVVTQVGHSAVRRFVMGEDVERSATNEEIARMAGLVAEAFDAGATAFSTSLVPVQVDHLGRHIPSYFAADQEIEALAAVARDKRRPLLTINPRTKVEGLVEEDRRFMAKLARISGAVVSWNNFFVRPADPKDPWETILDYLESEGRDGNHVMAIANCQPTRSSFSVDKLSPIFAGLQPWLDYSRLAQVEKRQALRDPSWRRRLIESSQRVPAVSQAVVEFGATPATKQLQGRSLADIARERGASPAEVMLDIAAEDGLQTLFTRPPDRGLHEGALARILKSPAVIVGISDGGAHLQTFNLPDYTTFFLQHWVRETGVFTLEEGVQALTSRPARFLGLRDRGTLEPGQAADVVVFDPQTVGPLPFQIVGDLPAGAQRKIKPAGGVPWVIVNGQPVVENAALTGAVPGRVVRRG